MSRLYIFAFRYLLFIFSLSLSFSAHSSDMYWTISTVSGKFSSASSACSAAVSRLVSLGSINAGSYPIPGNIQSAGPGAYASSCYYNFTRPDGKLNCPEKCTGPGQARTVGECQPPDTFDSTTGECIEPRDCSSVSPGIFKSPSGPVINSGGRNYVATGYGSSSACYNGCSYSISDRSSSCYADPGGSTGFCNYIGTGSGSQCSSPDAALGTTGDPLNPPDTPDVPPSDPNDPGCPPGYGWSGTTCAKNPDDGGGDSGGGDSGGGDSGGGDSGGGNSGGGDSGGGNSGGGDSGGGDGGGGDGSGDGSGNGSGDGSGNGSGNGSGDGSGTGDGDGEQPGTCDSGACGQLGQGDKGNFDDFSAEYDQLIEQTKAEIAAYKSRFGSLASRTIETNLSSGGPDLPCWSFSVFGKTFSICLSSFSGELQVIRYAILFIVAVICLFIIFGGSKEGN